MKGGGGGGGGQQDGRVKRKRTVREGEGFFFFESELRGQFLLKQRNTAVSVSMKIMAVQLQLHCRENWYLGTLSLVQVAVVVTCTYHWHTAIQLRCA